MIQWLKNKWNGEGRSSLSDPDALWDVHGQFYSSRSGLTVSPDTALTYSPVWQGLDLITSDVSRAKVQVYRRVETEWGEGKEPNRTHPAYNALRRHTGYMTSNLWIARVVGNAVMYGNGYSQIHKSTRGLKLEWLHPDWVTMRIQKSRRFYLVRRDPTTYDGPSEYRLDEGDMFHLVGLTLHELGGLSMVGYARNTVGRGISAEGYADDYFLNGGPAVIFSSPQKMSEEAQKRFIRGFADRHSGQGNRFKIGVVEQGMTANEVGMSAKDAQLIESLKWGVRDVARFFNLPPHKLGDDSRTSFNSVEEENRSYLNSSLGKWFSRFTSEANYKLFADDKSFCEFKTDSLLQANTVDRWTAHNIAIAARVKNPNEVRAEENLNPYEGGDHFLNPNIEPASNDSPEEDDTSTDEPTDEPTREALRSVAVDNYRILTDRVFLVAARKAKDPEKFLAWLNSLDTWRDTVDDQLRCSVLACGASVDDVPKIVTRYLQAVSRSLLESARGSETIDQSRRKVLADTETHVQQILEERQCT